MFYTVKDVAKRTKLSVHTIRYYAKEGLIPNIQRSESGIRMFKESDLEWFF
jgi:DNA-binding transcriptional MerR regulator